VRKYTLESVRVNQDTQVENQDAANKTPGQRQDNDKSVPWREQPLPSFFESLAPHSQELLRRARQGDMDAKPSVWDRKAGEWVRADKAKSRGLGGDVLKSRHLMNVELDGNQDDEEDEEDEEDADVEELNLPANASGAVPPSGKKRKIVSGPVERLIEIKRWVQVPMDKADKMTEPRFLADRRPGLGSGYTPAYIKSITAYGFGADSAGAGAAGFDLGDGGGLGNALGGAAAGGSAAGAESGNITPRRNIPPKRKKKKLGGPGRKKNAVIQAEREAAERAAALAAAGEGEVKVEGDEEKPTEGVEVKKEGEEGDGDEGSGDESEGEGSEEGEVNDDAAPAVLSADCTSVPAIPADPAVPVAAMVEEVAAIAEDTDMKDAPATATTATVDTATAEDIPSILVDEPQLQVEPKTAVPANTTTTVDGPAPDVTMAATASIDTTIENEPPVTSEVIREVKAEIAAAPESEKEEKMDLLGSIEAAVEEGIGKGA
jgi:hypothetical protein